jgi:hypothetical protein
VVTETHQVIVEVQPTIKSIFPPHAVLGLVSVLAETEIEVSHHTGQPARVANSAAVSIEASSSLADLPCEWAGTAHASMHHYITGSQDETGEIEGTFKFGNPQIIGNMVTYEIISGSATWSGTEVLPNICTFSDSGTYDDPQGILAFTDDGSGQVTYVGFAGPSTPEYPGGCALFSIYSLPYFNTCGQQQTATGLELSGNCVSDISNPGDPVGAHDEYEWHLDGISCSGARWLQPAAGTCGGP